MHTLLSDYQVGYVANLTLGSVIASVPGAPAAFSGTASYAHDTKLQLTNETSNRGGAYNFTSVYDGAGNPTTFKGTVNTFNNANQNTAYTHDGNGGCPLGATTYKGVTLTFDAENRMTEYGTVLTAGYRADGLRAWKQTSAGTTYYPYDGDKPVEELDGSGAKAAVTTFGPGGVLARTTATRTLLYSLDALGQMAQQIDAAAGTIVASYLFDAWGARQVSTGDPTAGSDPYSGYNTAAGYITDWETGLQLLGHRYFDPATGRFLNRDPIGMAGGLNVYGYLGNGPLLNSDPSGKTGVAAGVGGGFAGWGMGCLFSWFQAKVDIGNGSLCPAAFNCEWKLNCLLNSAIAILTTAAGMLDKTFPPWIIGCVGGAAAGLPGPAIQDMCNANAACPNAGAGGNPLCGLLRALESGINGAIAGCIGGYINQLDPQDPITGNIGGGMVAGGVGLVLGFIPWGALNRKLGCP